MVALPPKLKYLIRYYDLYSGRGKGKSRQTGRDEKFGVMKDEKPHRLDSERRR
jgi:hypothetical protein